MEEKKVTKKSVKTTAKTTKATEPKKTTAKKSTPAKAKKVEVVEEVKVEAVATEPAKVDATVVVDQPKAEKTEVKKTVTLNQELNLMVGLFGVLAIIAFCFAFQGGDAEILGWELLLSSTYSGVFKGIMVLYVVSIFIDCILAVRIDTENEILNIVEKVLYAFTLIMNFVTVAILVSLIEKIGIGLIMLLIISIVSVIVKLARIYSKK